MSCFRLDGKEERRAGHSEAREKKGMKGGEGGGVRGVGEGWSGRGRRGEGGQGREAGESTSPRAFCWLMRQPCDFKAVSSDNCSLSWSAGHDRTA